MFLLVLFSLVVGGAHNGTRNYEECKASDFASKSCWESKQLYKAGSFLCKTQDKNFDGSSSCKIGE